VEIGNSYGAEVNSREIVGWLRTLGGLEPNGKAVPECILRSPLAVHAAFLRGLFENGTPVLKDERLDHIEWSSVFPELELVVRTMLLRLGIITGATPSRPGSIYLYGQNARRFVEQVGFVATFKQQRAAREAGQETRYVIPLTRVEARSIGAAFASALTPATATNILTRRGISRHAAETALLTAAEKLDGAPTPEERLLRDRLGCHYSAVREVRRIVGPSMCIRVPDGHRFMQNGFCGWNSQGAEFPCLVLVVHKAHSFMHHRNLFYTGVTRARETVIVVGDQWGIRNCAAREQVERRKTFLSVLDLPVRGPST
jgi:hypothetical protein